MLYNFLAHEACLFLEEFCHQFCGNYSNQNKVEAQGVFRSQRACYSWSYFHLTKLKS